jgi:hypothetical protein
MECVIAFHLVCVEVGACGIRLVCRFLNLTGLDRFIAASYGAQQQGNLQVEQAMVTYHHDETVRLANGMPPKDLTVTQDETCTGGLCLITMDPESHFIILEQLAQARDQTTWRVLKLGGSSGAKELFRLHDGWQRAAVSGHRG